MEVLYLHLDEAFGWAPGDEHGRALVLKGYAVEVIFLVIGAYGNDVLVIFDGVFEHGLADGDDAGARVTWAVGVE